MNFTWGKRRKETFYFVFNFVAVFLLLSRTARSFWVCCCCVAAVVVAPCVVIIVVAVRVFRPSFIRFVFIFFFSLLLLRQIRRAEVGASAMWMLYMHVLNFLFRFMPFSFLFFVCTAFSVDFVCALLFFLFCFDGLFSILSCYFFSLYYCWRSLRLSSAQNQWAFSCSQSFAYLFNFFFSLRSFTLNFV